MPVILLSPYNFNRTFLDGLVLAMDFEGDGWVDIVKPSRTFAVTGSQSSRSTAQKINGTQSMLQTQLVSDRSGVLYTPRTADLTFTGDFWIEMWGYCFGQGNTTFTGGSNWMISFGHYASTGLTGLYLDNLKPSFAKPNGSIHGQILTSSVAASNNAWHHYALGRKDGVLYLFLNGQLVGSTPYADTFGFDDSMTIGGYQDARITNGSYASFNGYIDRLRIFDRCLTTTNFTPLVDSAT